jgi:hypothetical protein
MEKKGLCHTCVNDKGCTFPRKFPVLQCEEFAEGEVLVKDRQRHSTKCKRI